MSSRRFQRMDANGDGKVTQAERDLARSQRRGMGMGGGMGGGGGWGQRGDDKSGGGMERPDN